MGADLLCYVLSHKKKTTLDWDRGREFIRTCDPVLMEDVTRDSYTVDYGQDPEDIEEVLQQIEDCRQGLLDNLESVRHDVENGGRQINSYFFGDWVLYITGGMSWGDSPTELYSEMDSLVRVPGLLDAIGFEWPETTS